MRFKNKQGLSRSKQNVETVVKKKKKANLGWAKDYFLALFRIVLAVIAVLLAKYATEYIIEMNNFYATWWLQFSITAIIAVVILLTLGASFPSSENSKMTKKVVFGLMILFLLGWYLLPVINERNFDQFAQPIKWVNLKTREVYHKPLNPVEDINGKKFFLHPATLDTCVPLSKAQLQKKAKVVKPKETPKPVRRVSVPVKKTYIYDTIYSKVYREQGEFMTNLYGADVKKGDILRIYNINSQGVASLSINNNKKIFASALNREATYRIKQGAYAGIDLGFIAKNSDNSVVLIQLIRARI